jgi:hypothetical protein
VTEAAMPPPPAPPPAPSSGRASWALGLAVGALATGFLAVPLLGAVAANVLASLALQDIDAADGRVAGGDRARWAIALAVTALCVWIPVFVVAAATGGS